MPHYACVQWPVSLDVFPISRSYHTLKSMPPHECKDWFRRENGTFETSRQQPRMRWDLLPKHSVAYENTPAIHSNVCPIIALGMCLDEEKDCALCTRWTSKLSSKTRALQAHAGLYKVAPVTRHCFKQIMMIMPSTKSPAVAARRAFLWDLKQKLIDRTSWWAKHAWDAHLLWSHRCPAWCQMPAPLTVLRRLNALAAAWIPYTQLKLPIQNQILNLNFEDEFEFEILNLKYLTIQILVLEFV